MKKIFNLIKKLFTVIATPLIPVLSALRRHAPLLGMAVCITIVMMVICYIYDNIPHSLLGSANVAQRYEIAKTTITGACDKVPDDVLLINVAFDRELVSHYDELQPDFPAGVTPITDRKLLIEFFNRLSENPTYKYILCDVRFEPNIDSPELDDSLYNAIAMTPRMVIPMHEGEEPVDPRLFDKAGYCDYAVNFVESNFVKYEFYKNGNPSMPLKAYHEISGHTITPHGPVYTSGNHLCRKCVELKFPVRIYSEGVVAIDSLDINSGNGTISGSRRVYYNLGADILEMDVDLAEKAKDKIIVVGDFSGSDNHSTYLGDMPGAVINYNALCALINGDHIISPSEIIFLFTLYLLITIYILRGRSVMQTFVPYRIRIKLMRKLLPGKWSRRFLNMLRPRGTAMVIWSLAGIGAFLWIVSALCYIFTSIIIYLFIPTVIFTILKNFVIYVKLRKTNTRSRNHGKLSNATAPAC